MRHLNMGMSPPCDCKICIETGRNPDAEATSSGSLASEPCVFAGIFDTLLNKHGIKFRHHILRVGEKASEHPLYGQYFGVYPGDTMIVSFGVDRYWRDVAYGYELTSVTDPDKEALARLRTLFDVVNLNKRV